MTGVLNRNWHLSDIIVTCAPEDAGKPVLNGLALTIVEMEQGQLDLERISETTWKHKRNVEVITQSTNQLSFVALSTDGKDIGRVILSKEDWDNCSSGDRLKRDFEDVKMGLKLSLSLERMPSTRSAVESSTPSHEDGNPSMKAHQLNLYGDYLLQYFRVTQDEKIIQKAILAYKKAIACLSTDDPRLGPFLMDLCNAYQESYTRFGRKDDLDEAVVIGQTAIATTAETHSAFPTWLNKLGNAFLDRFEFTGDLDDISQAMQNQQRAIQLTPDGHSGLPDRLNNIGNSLLRRFERTGDLDNIFQAIQNQKRAVQLTPDGHAQLPGRLNNLGSTFLRYFERTGDLDNMSLAIENMQRAIQLTPEGHSQLPGRLNNLGIAFSHRFGRTGDVDDVSHAILNLQHAIRLTPDDHPDMPAWLNNLGSAFLDRFKCNGDLDDISQGIQIYLQAVRLIPEGHHHLPAQLNNLGNAYLDRFERTADLGDISLAIENLQAAIKSTPDGHADLPPWLNNVGSAFFHRFVHTGDLDDSSQAIQNFQRAIQLTPAGHSHLHSWFNNLGAAFSRRFKHTGSLDDISQAIQNLQRAMQLTPLGHVDLPSRLNNLGAAYLNRFGRTSELDDVSQAIQNQQRAVQLTSDGHPLLPSRLNLLGNSLLSRGLQTTDLDDISHAIQHLQRVVQLTPDGHAYLHAWLHNLGNSFLVRFRCTREPDDLSQAILNLQHAIRQTPDGHALLPGWLSNLGLAFSLCFECTGDLEDISEGIQHLQRAVQLTPVGHADLPGRLDVLGSAFSLQFSHTNSDESLSKAITYYRLAATSLTGPPSIRLRVAQRWADLSRHPEYVSQLLDAHECIIQLLSLVAGFETTIQRRHKTLVESSQLSIAAASDAFSLGRPDKALEWLQEGRCIVWNQINQLRTPLDGLRAHSPVLAERLSSVSRELENAGSRIILDSTEGLSMEEKISLEEQAGRHISLAKERDELLATIRNIADFEDFLRPRKCADIMRRLPSEGPVIIINVHHNRCDALALKDGASMPIHVHLPKFSYQEAERLAKGLYHHLLRHGVRLRKGTPLTSEDSSLPDIKLASVLRVLWSEVVWPILDALAFSAPNSSEKLPRLWWCPTGPLAFLPIHAAGIYDHGHGERKQCLSDFAVSSYIPTLNSFFKTSGSDSVVKQGNIPIGLLIVSQPNTPEKSPIPYAADEAERINKQLRIRGIPTLTLNDEKGTISRLLGAMESFPSVHLACHASQNMEDPLKSSIFLHDGQLELSEIMKKDLPHSNFAFLSACQTSKGDESLPEEVVHLAAGMLAAGYRSIVGTMWSIFDSHGPDVAEFFYDRLLDSGMNEKSTVDGAGAARALHHAIEHLREKVSDSPDHLHMWVPYIHIGI